ncbi:4538_t:CDS:2 [Funneliformis caledonium]|uniref:4538_t:CDS:1 n=1 Tax=Funneliformis caledonium TaxID=1117310 RepID=A0A9N9CR81_9GLOM|nr:4538_t:CDS:2 [Funneliformis caledonium]
MKTFSIKENGIIVNYSDAINLRINYPNDKRIKISKDGSKFIKIDHIKNDHYKIQTKWLKPLGILIANYLRQKHNLPIREDQEYLLNFPSGYEFFDYVTYNDTSLTTKVRTDNYLFGKYRFRSTNEFLPHLIWMISDKSEECECCYCPKNSRTAKKKRELEISASTSLENTMKKQRINKLTPLSLLSISTLPNKYSLINKSPTISFNSKNTLPKFSSLAPSYNNDSSLQRVSFYSPNNPQISKISYYSLNNNNHATSSLVKESNSFDHLCKAQYRVNEIVWICLLSDDSMETFENINKVITNHNARIPYWPALITNSTFNTSVSKYVYTVKFIYLVVEEINVLEDYISPFSFSLVDITNKIRSNQVKVICHSHYRYLEVISCVTHLKKTFTLYSPSYDAENNLYHYDSILIGAEEITLGDTVKLASTTDLFIIKDITSDSDRDNVKFIGNYVLDDKDDKQQQLPPQHLSQISININQIGGKNYTRFPKIFYIVN